MRLFVHADPDVNWSNLKFDISLFVTFLAVLRLGLVLPVVLRLKIKWQFKVQCRFLIPALNAGVDQALSFSVLSMDVCKTSRCVRPVDWGRNKISSLYNIS